MSPKWVIHYVMFLFFFFSFLKNISHSLDHSSRALRVGNFRTVNNSVFSDTTAIDSDNAIIEQFENFKI